jgi:hypothetical protein
MWYSSYPEIVVDFTCQRRPVSWNLRYHVVWMALITLIAENLTRFKMSSIV